MGWQNPPIPWRELERRLSGRPAPPGQLDGSRPGNQAGAAQAGEVVGDGGDSVAWSRHRPAYVAPALIRPTHTVPYAELHAHSSFSHLDGASLPEEMVEAGVEHGLNALALTDHNGMYGVVRFAEAAGVGLRHDLRSRALPLHPGAHDERRALDKCPGRRAGSRRVATCWCSPAIPLAMPACAA